MLSSRFFINCHSITPPLLRIKLITLLYSGS
nr:MAG TPA: hypothetical protein [Bacteriophage sp.]